MSENKNQNQKPAPHPTPAPKPEKSIIIEKRHVDLSEHPITEGVWQPVMSGDKPVPPGQGGGSDAGGNSSGNGNNSGTGE